MKSVTIVGASSVLLAWLWLTDLWCFVSIRRTKSNAKSVFIDDEAREADEESEGEEEEEEEEEETSVVEESIEEIVAESVESATESVSESVKVVQVVKVEKWVILLLFRCTPLIFSITERERVKTRQRR